MARVAVLGTRFPHISHVTKSNMLREMDSNFNVQNLATLSFTVVDIAYSKLLYILAGPPGSSGGWTAGTIYQYSAGHPQPCSSIKF